ncbi:MAG: cytochrome P450 [Nocardioidaceae bacterium]
MTTWSTRVQWKLGRLLLARGGGRGGTLATLPLVPRSLRMLFQRDGLDPVAPLGRLRESAPVSPLKRLFGITIWLVSGHPETQAVLADTTNYSNDIRPYVGLDPTIPENHVGGLGFTDPPEHSRLRKILTPEFTMRRLERLRPRIAQIVEQQLDQVEAAGPVVDLVDSFAFPIPFLVICELLGLPDEDRAAFRRIGRARFDLTEGGVGAFGAATESRAFLLSVTRKQRENPTDGLIGRIIRDHGTEIDDLELSGLADGVFTGGFETSASMLALGSLVLLQNPREWAALRRDDAAVDRVVEELLRYLGVVQLAFPRFARRDLELFGQKISAGDVLLCSLAGANRDARLGPDMGRFDPLREPTAHLAFGHGFHRCVGAELARMELRTAYPALARRFPRMRLAADPSTLIFRKLSAVYGIDSLPVQLR